MVREGVDVVHGFTCTGVPSFGRQADVITVGSGTDAAPSVTHAQSDPWTGSIVDRETVAVDVCHTKGTYGSHVIEDANKEFIV